MPITASYTPATFTLSVTGTTLGEAMSIDRDAAGFLRVNGGAITISGGTPTVANTDLIAVAGGDGDDTITLDETNGAMPKGDLGGGNGNDTLTGGSGNDTLTGEANNDTLFGRGGADLLFGGADNDVLTGGDGDDQMFGQDGDDRMIWNPGDDSDLMEGGNGTDTAEVNGGNGAEVFTITANGTRVRFDRVDPAPFALDIGTTENLVVNANGGDDTISTSGNLAALISVTIDGGAGNDTILGGNGTDTLFGGDNDDFVDGNQGNDTVFLGNGNDTFNWDPGDGSDIVEGQAGTDTMVFNASAANEIIDVSANGARARLTRNVGNIVQDMDDVEKLTLNALGGTDSITINDLTGTDLTQVDINLAGTIGGSSGDAAVDTIVVNGSAAANTISVVGVGTNVSVTGLAAAVGITNVEAANDALTVNGLGDNDSIIATTVQTGVIKLTLDGGAGNDSLFGSQSADTFLGGDGADYVFGDNGDDTAFLGNGDDVFEWNVGDGNDIIEGQANFDELRFSGANIIENINIAANGGRVLFTRDVANVTMDMDDVERIRFNAFGGADNITIGDLTGTDASSIDLRLAASGGGGDGAVDTVTVNASNGADQFGVSAPGGIVTVYGLPWGITLQDAEGANDRLTINSNAGDDIIDASFLAAGLISLTVNGGLGNDRFFGSAGSDLFVGGDGNDVALLGAGDDTVLWNPGDDNDFIEGGAGFDTLQFNGANIAETITVSANAGRILFFRDVAAVTMDMDDTEVIKFAALGGADTITVNDLAGTDLAEIALDLAGTLGGASGDGLVDKVTLNGTGAANVIVLGGTAALLTVSGLPWTASLLHVETADTLTVLAGGGDDNINALALNSALVTLSVDGGSGSDIIRSFGDGTYLGGAGNDFIYAGLTSSSEVLDGGADIDTLDTTSWGGIYNINMITGVTNYSGESFLNFEVVITGDGNDTITGTAGANTIRTNVGTDTINAGDGDDVVEGGAGGDTLDGGIGNDTLDYSTSNAAVSVSLATGVASGGHAAGDIIANFENLLGSAFSDSLTGNSGANVINGAAGGDAMSGLGGDDIYVVDSAGDTIIEANGGGTDIVYAGVGYTLNANASVELLTTPSIAGTQAIDMTGNNLDNTIWGNRGNNTLSGGIGGHDTLVGFAGNDIYLINNTDEVIVENAGEGTDIVYVNSSYTLSRDASIELLSTFSIAGTQAYNMTGNNLDNTIWGNRGNNTLSGGIGGHDTLVGFLGDDIYLINNGDEVISEQVGEGTDIAYAGVSHVLSAGASIELLSTNSIGGVNAINLTGNELGQTLWGNNGANILNGGLGADTLNGFGGADTFAFTTALGGGNIDILSDFAPGADKIALDDAIFGTGIGTPGAFNANAFFAGTAAHDGDDRIIYNAATGQLLYDADGTGAGAAVLFATLSGNPALAASDFLVI